MQKYVDTWHKLCYHIQNYHKGKYALHIIQIRTNLLNGTLEIVFNATMVGLHIPVFNFKLTCYRFQYWCKKVHAEKCFSRSGQYQDTQKGSGGFTFGSFGLFVWFSLIHYSAFSAAKTIEH